MYIHIGAQIEQRAIELRMGPTELSKLISTSKQNVYGIFKRKSIDSDLLLRMCIILDYDFFQLYTNLKRTLKSDIKIENTFQSRMPKVSSQVDMLQKDLEVLKKENALKDRMIKLLEDKIQKYENQIKREERYLNILKSQS